MSRSSGCIMHVGIGNVEDLRDDASHAQLHGANEITLVAALAQLELCGNQVSSGRWIISSQPRGYLLCAEEHIKQNEVSRHGHATEKSMTPMARKLLNGGVDRPHGQDAAFTRTQGDRLAFLIRLMLGHIGRCGFLDRCERPPPKAACCPLKFHRMHARRLSKNDVGVPFDAMDRRSQRRFLYEFMCERWSTSIDGSCMLPHPPLRWRPCAASWGHFWMTQVEAEILLEMILPEYNKYKHIF